MRKKGPQGVAATQPKSCRDANSRNACVFSLPTPINDYVKKPIMLRLRTLGVDGSNHSVSPA